MTPIARSAPTSPTEKSLRAEGRIVGEPVSPLLPSSGEVFVLLVGEAPGPRGADKSGVPFFGDAAGKHLYGALVQMGAVELPALCSALPWDGALFRRNNLVPTARGVALGNAFDRCPTDNGASFRAPSRAELEGEANLARLQRELTVLRARGLRGIVTLGRVAARTIEAVCARDAESGALLRVGVPHPSAQGLLSMAPNRGRGAKMSDLQDQWAVRCIEAVYQAGHPRPSEGAST